MHTKFFDFNFHLPTAISDGSTCTFDEKSPSFKDLKENFQKYFIANDVELYGSNFMLLNDQLFKSPACDTFYSLLSENLQEHLVTALIDFRSSNPFHYLDLAFSKGAKGIKFHPYIQDILFSDFEKIVKICQHAESLGMFITIDTSYGSLGLYQNDNLALAVEIAKKVKKAPIVLLHSGGARVFDAMLICQTQDNLFLETSFSANFYQHSSIENDFAFAYKKISAKKVLYGSDAPYINPGDNIDFTLKYLERNAFSSSEIEDIMCNNALTLMGRL